MNILIIRVSAIGDVIHTLPSIFYLKTILPNVKISWIVQKKAASLIANQPFLEKIYVLPDKYLYPSNWSKTIKIIKQINQIKWSAIIDFQGIIKTSILLLTLKGKKFGFDKIHARLGLTALFTKYHTIPVFTNIIQKNLSLVSNVTSTLLPEQTTCCPSIQSFKKNFFLKIPNNYKQKVQQWLKINNIKKCILLIPNTTWPSKHWPIEHWRSFLLLLESYLQKTSSDYSTVLVGKNFGNQANKLSEFIQQKQLKTAIAPNWNLLITASLIAQSKLIVAPDTGLLHLADFMGTKTIGIFGPTLVKKHGPFLLDENKKNAIQIKCPHLYKKHHDGKDCMNKLLPIQLFKIVLRIINK